MSRFIVSVLTVFEGASVRENKNYGILQDTIEFINEGFV